MFAVFLSSPIHALGNNGNNAIESDAVAAAIAHDVDVNMTTNEANPQAVIDSNVDQNMVTLSKPLNAALCGGTVFRDDDGNGVFGSGEPTVAGVVIGAYDSDGTLLGDVATDGTGVWSIPDLPDNTDIRLQIVSKPGALTPAPLGADNQGLVVFTNTSTCGTVNFGLLLASACSQLPLEIGNRIWVDDNGDGEQNAGEAGIVGVTVTLYDASDTQIAQKVTGADGIYLFTDADGLLPNTDYKIRIDNADDYTITGPLFEMNLTNGFQGSNPELDSDAQTIASYAQISLTSGSVGSSIHRYDIGFTPPATIGDLVWFDVNGNNVRDTYDESYTQLFQDLDDAWNGLIDLTALLPVTDTNITEPGFANVTLNLYGPGPDGIAGTGDDELLTSTVTDPNGYYQFRPVTPGIPHRVEIDTRTLPAGVQPTFDEDGAGDHAITVVALTPGQQHLSADFGYGGNIDLGIVKTATQPYWDQSATTEWTIDVTNHGSMSAPKVVVGDVLGEYTEFPSLESKDGDPYPVGVDVILSRALLLVWSVDANGNFNLLPDYLDRDSVEEVVADWVDNNVSVSGTDWTCTVEHRVNYPFGWNWSNPDTVKQAFRTSLYGGFEDSSGSVPMLDLNLYWMCELTSGDLAAGANAPSITFSVSNEFNGWTHDLEHTWADGGDYPSDLYGIISSATVDGVDASAQQLNSVVTSSALGEELFGTVSNEDTALIVGNGDLEWSKQITSPLPVDVGDSVAFELSVTNTGTRPYYRPIFLADSMTSNMEIDPNSISAAQWSCKVGTRTLDCAHAAIAGGLAVGDSLTITYSAKLTGINASSRGLISSPTNTVQANYSSSADDNTGNNSSVVPITLLTTSFSAAKGAGIQFGNEIEWTVTSSMGGTVVPTGQVLVIEERLPSAFISVTPNGWQCEAHPSATAGANSEHWQMCWYDPPDPHNSATPIPDLIIRSEFIDAIVNTACPARGFRLGVQDWDFGDNNAICDSSPTFGGVPIVPTDLAIAKSHSVEPWIRGQNYTYLLTISENNVGPDWPVVTDQLAPGQTFVDIRNASGQSLLDGNGDPIAGRGWICNANFTDDPATVPDESERVVCTRDTQLSGNPSDAFPTSDTLTVEVTVESFAGQIVHNDAWVKGLTRAEPYKNAATLNTCELNPDNSYPRGICDNDTEDDVPVSTPDLEISKTHVDPVIAGVPFDFTITIGNNNDFSAIPAGDPVPIAGPLPLPVTVTDTFPLGLNYLGFSGTGWTCSSDGAVPPVITCTFDDADHQLMPGESAPALLINTVAPTTAVAQTTNSAAIGTNLSPIIVYSGTPDSVQDNLDILAPYVVAKKSASRSQSLVNDPTTGTFDFSLSIENLLGTGEAVAPVRITDTIPTEFGINTISGSDWDCSASSGQVVDCTYTGGGAGAVNFPANTTSAVTVNVTTSLSATSGSVENTMVASHGGIQAIDSVLTSYTTVSVLRYAELSVSKTRDIASPLPGDTVAYTAIVTNTGVSPAQDVQVVDLLPYGTTYVDSLGSDPAWSCSSDNGTPERVTCDLTGDLAGNGTVAPTLVIRLLVSAEAMPGMANFISVNSSTATTPGSTIVPYHVDDYVVLTGCIGDYVWWDHDGDGVEEGVEAGDDATFDTLDDIFGINGPGPDGALGTGDDCSHGFENVNLSLDWAGIDNIFGTGDDLTQALTTTTDNRGYYAFEFLLPGEYRVHVDNSSGTLVCDGDSFSSFSPTFDLDSGTTNPDNTTELTVGGASPLVRMDADFGYLKSNPILGAIGNYVWLDENSDGYQDAGERGIANVMVNMTDGNGTVYTTTTDAHGGYLFDDLPEGTYTVTIPASNQSTDGALEGLTQSTAQPIPAGSDFGNQTSPYVITLGAGEENLTADFGYNHNPTDDVNNNQNNAALGDYVWIDSDGDGAQDPNEIGVEGVTLTIYHDPDGNGVYDTPYTEGGYTPTTTTDENGFYLFDDLAPGAYVVTVTDDSGASHDVLNTTNYTQTGDPDHFGTTGATNDNTTTTPVVLAPGDVFLNVDFGYQPTGAPLGSIGNTVWFDADADQVGPTINAENQGAAGTPDGNEYGIPGVTVVLIKDSDGDGTWDAGEPIIATDITDQNGQYLFEDLPITDGAGSDDYLVWVNDTESVLRGLTATYDDDGLTSPNSGQVTGANISSVLDLTTTPVTDQDFGYTPDDQTSSLGLIGDFIWLDSNNSGTSTSDAGEAGIEGVIVSLTFETGFVLQTTTDENGYYYFGGLTLDQTYTVTVDASNFAGGGVLEGMSNSYDPDGTTSVNTGEAVTLTAGSPVNLEQDFSYYATTNGQLGNLVWLDSDADGEWDGDSGTVGSSDSDGDEPILAGVTVDLYRDLDGDGHVDPNEPRIAKGVTVGSLTSTVSDDGNYLFAGLPTTNTGAACGGSAYVVHVTDADGVLAGYWHSLGTQGTTNHSQIDPYGDDGSGALCLTDGTPTNMTADFGYYVEPAAVGNFVWEDTDEDGLQDDGEPAIANAVVTLQISYPDGSNVSLVTTTDNDGYYAFSNLLIDEDYNGDGNAPEPTYTISVATPAGYNPTTVDAPAATDDKNDSDDHSGVSAQPIQGLTDTSAIDPVTDEPVIASYDFGFVLPVGELGAIGNYVWLDENSDGYQDAGEPGIANVIVSMTDGDGTVYTTTTDAHGGYLFDDLPAGSYTVTIPASNQSTDGALEGLTQTTAQPIPAQVDFGNQTSPYVITLGAGEENLTADFGYNHNPTDEVDNPTGSPNAALGDRIWIDSDGDGAQDPNEIGVEGVTLTIYHDPDGNGVYDTPYTEGGYTATTTTDENGFYLFDDLPPGAYVVTVTDDSGASHDVLNSTNYSQTGDPDHFGTTGSSNDNTTTTPVVLAPGDVFLNADFGYQPTSAPLGSIGNTVWFDADADQVGPTINAENQGAAGTPDSNEYGIPGVTVVLIKDSDGDGTWDAGEPIIATDITDQNGQYLFDDLPITDGAGSDDYLVWVNDTESVLKGLTATYDADGLTTPNSGQVTGANISSVLDLTTTPVTDQDFGYTPDDQTSTLGLIGDTIWFDSNNNGSSTPETGEPGIEGVIVNLTLENGSVLQTTTDENGHYYFAGLTLNQTYTVTVDASNFAGGGVLEGMSNTYDPDGSTPVNTGQAVTLTSGSPINLDQDFSYTGTTGELGNLIWLDLNADGDYDSASESPIANVTVDLYRDLDCDGYLDPAEGLFAQTTTVGTIDAGTYQTDGVYLFSNLPVSGQGTNSGACFVVDVSDTNGVLAGYWHSLGTTGTDNHSQTDPYGNDGSGELELTSVNPSDLTADFGYYVLPAAVGNYVWLDDGDGIQESGEMGLNGITVTLTITYADGTNISLVTVTADAPNGGDAGHYSFGNLLFDEDYRLGNNNSTPTASQPAYSVAVTTPSGYQTTLTNVGSGGTPDMNDSDAHSGVIAIPTQGQTNTSQNSDANAESEPIASYDFGFYLDMDFGDLPDSFDTIAGSDGARHSIISNLYLGSCVDGENDGVPDNEAGVDASGGDNNSSGMGPVGTCSSDDDEDGVKLVTPLIAGQEACMAVDGYVASGTAVLNGWIDFNGDDDFDGDANEQLTFTRVAGVALETATTEGVVPNGTSTARQYCFTVPAGATFTGGETHMRFRLSSAGSLSFNSAASNGEVEDYYQPLVCVGNLIWEDVDKDGEQDSGTETGIDGVGVNLVWGGADGNIATTADNLTVSTTSAGGGLYNFCGLIPDDASGNGGSYQISIPTPSATYPDATVTNAVDDRIDSDGTQSEGSGTAVTGPEFTISAPNYSAATLFSLPSSENGISDNPGSYNSYPDSSDDISNDFGFTSSPLAVQLADFSAVCDMSEGYVNIQWQTVSELDNLGFNVYRSTQVGEQGQLISQELIPSQAPGSGQGAAYNWQDENIELGGSYYYLLESIDVQGVASLAGVVDSACDSIPTAVQLSALEAERDLSFALYGLLMTLALGISLWRWRRQ